MKKSAKFSIAILVISAAVVISWTAVFSAPLSSPPEPGDVVATSGSHLPEPEPEHDKTAATPTGMEEMMILQNSVTWITDGDTIKVDGSSVRFALASAPELSEDGGIEARTLIEKICPVGSAVTVDEDDGQPKGSYGRTLAVVYCNGINLNAKLLDSGLGYIDVRFCDESEFSGHDWAQRHGCGSSAVQQTQIESQDQQRGCDPSYPDVCISPYPPDLDCGDTVHKNFRVLPPDPHRFDGDRDGMGCEG